MKRLNENDIFNSKHGYVQTKFNRFCIEFTFYYGAQNLVTTTFEQQPIWPRKKI